MANTFNRVIKTDVPSTEFEAYVVPELTTAIIIGFVLSNKSAGEVQISAKCANTQITGSNTVIPATQALSILDGKIVLVAGDTIDLICNQDSVCDAMISILEIS